MKMRSVVGTAILAVVVSACAWGLLGAQSGAKPDLSKAMPPKAIPTFSTENLARTGFFFAGGEYVESKAPNQAGQKIMHGAMYTEVWVPKTIRHPYPVIFYHGAGQTGVDWLQTPDGRPGWAYYFIDQGYVLYMLDYPTRGRSAYVPGVDGNFTIRTANNLEEIWTDARVNPDGTKSCGGRPCPTGMAHTQWNGPGTMGDPVFDTFVKSQVQFAGPSTDLAGKASLDLIDKIGTPVILFTHSQGGSVGWEVANARASMVKGIVTVEPGGGVDRQMLNYDPPITAITDLKTVMEAKGEREGENPCRMQIEPARKLAANGLRNIPILDISGDGGYHRAGDACPPKWINQAGGHVEYVRLEDVGIKGNGHMMMLEKNSDVVVKFIGTWMDKNIK